MATAAERGQRISEKAHRRVLRPYSIYSRLRRVNGHRGRGNAVRKSAEDPNGNEKALFYAALRDASVNFSCVQPTEWQSIKQLYSLSKQYFSKNSCFEIFYVYWEKKYGFGRTVMQSYSHYLNSIESLSLIDRIE